MQLTSSGNGDVDHLFCYQCFVVLELPAEYTNLTIKGDLSQIETMLHRHLADA
jgi:hypothetical protein